MTASSSANSVVPGAGVPENVIDADRRATFKLQRKCDRLSGISAGLKLLCRPCPQLHRLIAVAGNHRTGKVHHVATQLNIDFPSDEAAWPNELNVSRDTIARSALRMAFAC